MRVVIIGCGEIGVLCARQLLDAGHQVTGVRRTASALPHWMDSCSADVTNPVSLEFLRDETIDVIIYQVAARGFNEQAYRQAYVEGVANVVEKCQRTSPHLFFVSSTGVYHQNDGGWVDETSATRPQKFNGQLMLEGEKLVACVERASSVRFSGIYGPQRTRLIDRVKNGESGNDTDAYTNRIHVADCAGVLAHLAVLAYKARQLGGQPLQRVYLASDSLPALRSDVFNFLASELGTSKVAANSVAQQQTDAIGSRMSPLVKRIAGSKRCCNQRILDTGYQFLYPDYQSGYRQIISDIASSDNANNSSF